MRREENEKATGRIRSLISNWSLLERPLFHRFEAKLQQGKIMEGLFFVTGLLAFLAVYLVFLNLIIWAHFPAGLFP